MRELRRKWRLANPERTQGHYRKWYSQNKDVAQAKTRVWQLANPERTREWKRKWSKENRWSSLLAGARARAKRRGLSFNLTREWLQERLRLGVCEATGVGFVTKGSRNWRVHPLAPSLDRVNPKKGYTRENTMLVTWHFNTAKSQYGLEELLAMSLALVTRHGLVSVARESEACGPKKTRGKRK